MKLQIRRNNVLGTIDTAIITQIIIITNIRCECISPTDQQRSINASVSRLWLDQLTCFIKFVYR